MEDVVEGAKEVWEGGIARALVRHLSAGTRLHVASSMPVRDLDAYGTGRSEPLIVTSNRGANGIDGLIATALGQAAVLASGRQWLLIGDIATMHDVGALLHAHRHEASRRLVVVVVDNGGGAIFEHLPISEHREHFVSHFLTPHQLDWASLAHTARATHVRVEDQAALVAWIKALESQEPSGLVVMEVVVDRAANVARHKDAWARVAHVLDQEGATDA